MDLHSKRVLIVDDSVFHTTMMKSVLENFGFQSLSLTSGVGIKNTIIEYGPQIVLLDLKLPDLSGEEILKIIRSEHNSIELPVIMISGNEETTKIVEMLKMGANDYVTKPFEFEIILARIELHLKVSRLTRELSLRKEHDTIQAMVTTYNHEINNPLAIAMGCLSIIKSNPSDIKRIEVLENSLNRIHEITKKIDGLHGSGNLEKANYAGSVSKMYKVK